MQVQQVLAQEPVQQAAPVQTPPPVQTAPKAPEVSADPVEGELITAPMPGTILDVKVKAGGGLLSDANGLGVDGQYSLPVYESLTTGDLVNIIESANFANV